MDDFIINDPLLLEANKYMIPFYYVYKYSSYSKAADNYFQAASIKYFRHSVHELEALYNTKIVNVKNRNQLVFTEFGHVLAAQAKKIYETTIESSKLLERLKLKEIRFATMPDFYEYYIKKVFLNYMSIHKNVKIVLYTLNQESGIQSLLNREIDFYVGIMPEKKHEELQYTANGEARILLAVRESEKDSFAGLTSFKKLKNLRGATHNSKDPLLENLNASLKKEGTQLNIVFYGNNFSSIVESVNNGFASYAIVGNYTECPGIKFYDISHLCNKMELAFIHRKGENHSRAMDRLLKISQSMNIQPI